MNQTIITAGAKGADIDVLACAVAYAELLRMEGVSALPVIAGQFTMSVTPSMFDWDFEYETEHTPKDTDNFVLVDISDPNHVPSFVDLEKVIEVYDHRYGHQDYWDKKIGESSHIEMVGSCGTLIWEEFKKRGKIDDISRASARLLLASIVSNTLNFQVPITAERDHQAFKELWEISDLPDNWVEQYFTEQENILFADFETYLDTDTKRFTLPDGDFVIGQIELWNADKVVQTKIDLIDRVMNKHRNSPWIVNIPSISEGFNYIYSQNTAGKERIAQILGVSFDENGVAKTKELIMRKQIMKLLMVD